MTAGQPLTAVQTSGETDVREGQRGKVRALKAARPRQGEEQVKARSRVTDNQLQSTSLTLGVMLVPVDSCGACVIFCVIQCVTFQRNSKLLVPKRNDVVGEMIKESGGLFVPAEAGARDRFSPSRPGSGAAGGGLPGLADGANGELETGVLRPQGNAGRPRS